jgi:riboflavin kinase/FMN adenylyltransferase
MLKSSTTSVKKDSIESIAIGSFDGLHIAHMKLFEQLDEHGAVLIIDKGFTPALTPGKERCQYMKHPCFFLEFESIKDMEALEFAAYLRTLFPRLKKIVVGYDFRFGKNRGGDPLLLQSLQGIEVIVVEEQSHEDISIHAREIRQLLQKGKIEDANKLLGRAYSIRGDVISGQGLGKKSLYPTFNMTTGDFLLPKEGVYITKVVIFGKSYPALTFIGKRLSVDGVFSVESHVLDESLNLQPSEIKVEFLAYLRPNRKFPSLKVLKEQISDDIQKAKHFFTA